MKQKIKKWAALCLCILITLSLAGCGDTASPQEEVVPVGAEELKMVLDNIATLQLYTMGSSGETVLKAMSLLDWCQATNLTDEEITAEVKAYIDALAENRRAAFTEQLLTVTDSCEMMKDIDYIAATIVELERDLEDLEWSDKAYERATVVAAAAITE